MPFQIYVKEWVQREHRQGLLEMKESGGGKKVPPSATLQARATFGYLQKQLSTRSLAAHFICDFTSNNPEPLSLMDPLYKGIKNLAKALQNWLQILLCNHESQWKFFHFIWTWNLQSVDSKLEHKAEKLSVLWVSQAIQPRPPTYSPDPGSVGPCVRCRTLGWCRSDRGGGGLWAWWQGRDEKGCHRCRTNPKRSVLHLLL